jgi:hypothetical protein
MPLGNYVLRDKAKDRASMKPLFTSLIITCVLLWFTSCHRTELEQAAAEQTKPTSVFSEPCLAPQSNKKISAVEAVKLAECFVTANGYTDLPPMVDISKLSYESWADGPPAEEALKKRHNMLERKASGIQQGIKRVGKVWAGWLVAFRYSSNYARYRNFMPDYDKHIKKYVRAVSLDEYGKEMKVEHEDFRLSDFQGIEEGTR